MYSDEITLIKTEDTVTDTGDYVEIDAKRKTLIADKKSVKRSEFYEAAANGLKPELIFNIADYEDYEEEKYLEHNNIRYKVLRTFKLDDWSLDITVYDGVHKSEV